MMMMMMTVMTIGERSGKKKNLTEEELSGELTFVETLPPGNAFHGKKA